METTQKQRDEMAGVVLARYRRAKEYREQHIVHQGRSFDGLLDRAYRQYRREYTSEDAASMQEAFGFCPTRYYGVTQQKVNATVAWNSDLVINNLDGMFTASPSPEPTLDRASIERIRQQVRRDLIARMVQNGVSDATLLLNAQGRPDSRMEDWLRDQVRDLRRIEQARLISVASEAATRAQRRMRDITIEGGFRQAYMAYSHDRILTGTGVIKFPDWQQRAMLTHSGKTAQLKWETKPWFRHVRTQDFYPICDAIDLQTNTGNTEVTYITKAELINMSRQDNYFESSIREIIEDFEYRSRNWIEASYIGDLGDESWWSLDDTIPILIHEGFFSGGELAEYGITGLDEMDYVSARVEVCGFHTIRCELLRMPGGADRSYFSAPFVKAGTNLLDNLGLAAMLWDTEQRVNRMMHVFEHNLDWSARPPRLTNSSVFSNPNQAHDIVPGESYDVEDRWATSGTLPEPVRSINTVSAQYHLIMTQVGALLRQADEDCGIPAFAYGAQDFGRSSLGEYSQRMSNALRSIKQSALNEDIHFIEPAFRGLFHYEMENDEKIAEGQDVNLVIRGMTGLLAEDQKNQRAAQVLPTLIQMSSTPLGQQLVPQEALRYAVYNLLQQAGFPVDALGLSDPTIEQALAVAANTPLPGANPGGPQVPQLDGRSAVPGSSVASPSGASNFAIPSPGL